MTISFPASPTNGQIYTPGGGAPGYIYNSAFGVWKILGVAVSTVTGPTGPIGVTGPTGPAPSSYTTQAIDDNTTAPATTAFVVGQASGTAPVMNGTATIGISLRYARQDHVHATDTSRAPTASAIFTGNTSLYDTSPLLIMKATGGGTDSKFSDISATSTGVTFRLVNDAYTAATNYIALARTGYGATTLTLAATTVNLNGTVNINGVAVATQAYANSQDSAYYNAASAGWVAADTVTTNWVNANFMTINSNGSLNTLYVGSGTTQNQSGCFCKYDGVATQPYVPWSWICGITCSYGVMATGFMSFSDVRGKENIKDITDDDGVDWVKRGRPKTFTVDGAPASGFIAQEELDNGRGTSIIAMPSEDKRFAKSDGYVIDGHRLSKDYLHDIAYLTAALKSSLKRTEVLESALTSAMIRLEALEARKD